jgi:PAS domain S-box-containing protein
MRILNGVILMQFADDLFTGLMEAAPDAMVCMDADGRIAGINAQAELLFGYPREELIGQPLEVLVPDQARAVHPGHRAGYLANPRPRPMGAGIELAGRRRDGSTFPAEISLSAIDTDGGILAVAAVRDVTQRLEAQAERERLRMQAERGRLEHQLHQSQRLESLGQLAGGVAHDFNNLLGVISSYAAFVAKEIARQGPGERWQSISDDIEHVQQAAKRAADLTHQLLAFARQEVIQPRAMSLNDTVAAMKELLTRTLGEHIELIIDLAGDLPQVLADQGQLEQVLVNLAVNARDAMPGGGKLTIETAIEQVDELAASTKGPSPGRYVTVAVSDTGSGIPPHLLDRVFEPFFSTKPQGQGTGLGLATVYGIVNQAGGTVRIYSEPGQGTTLQVYLPVTVGAVGSAESPALAQPGAGQVVLVVEDEPALREVTRRTLVENGYQVIAAASGTEALSFFTSRPEHIDLLLTDVIMPQMQGKELADKVLALHPDTPVVFMSGYTQGLLSTQGVQEPGIHLIEKPFSEATLLTKLHQVLREPSARPGA